MPQEETVVGGSAYPYSEEVLVEVTARDADDDLVVYSYQFSVADDDTVTPIEGVPDRHCEAVGRALDDKGYESTTDLADAPS